MPSEIESLLRKLMFWMGTALERGIHAAKRARMQMDTRGGIKPVLSIESQLPPDFFMKLISASEEKILRTTVPHLQDKQALEISGGESLFLSHLLHRGARRVLAVESPRLMGTRIQSDGIRGLIVKGEATALPIPSASVDYVVARFTSQGMGDLSVALKNVSRVLVAGGQGVVVDFHPYGRIAKPDAQRTKAFQSGARALEDYYKLCREVGLRVVDLREAFLGDDLRKHFSEREIPVYRQLKGNPLLVFLYLYKAKANV
ncbi:MAG: methyltransferase domain-containing protein [Deltaproteobacteria bacterium]|nr:methyltransferase domain-containing protein [Deltaproteobacteria bacterium]